MNFLNFRVFFTKKEVKKYGLIIVLVSSFCQYLFSQPIIEWSEDYNITLADFKDTPPDMAEDNMQMYNVGIQINLNFAMGGYQFMLTKNFNKYVSADLYPMSSWMEPGEYADTFVGISNLSFDLAEVYARKLRQAMYENKKAFSNANFYQKESQRILDEYTDEQSVMHSELLNQNDEGNKAKWEAKIQAALTEMADYCKSCKPPKKKKG